MRIICIKEWLGKSPPENLVIAPLFDGENKIKGNAVDIRLDGKFIKLIKRNVISREDIKNGEIISDIVNCKVKLAISDTEAFIVHPNQLIIGSSLEYITLPYNLMAYIIGQSSLCKMGLGIYSTSLYPGFSGTVTLELCNHGKIPIILTRGLRIAQLVVYNIDDQSNQITK